METVVADAAYYGSAVLTGILIALVMLWWRGDE